ncbi:MAG: hypothetical protein JXQ72_11815 [Anaerolineae bacterium]|nr:hypothetical protein [Anaerolineae bacterium]
MADITTNTTSDVTLRIRFEDLLAVIDQLQPDQKAMIRQRLSAASGEPDADDYYSLEQVNRRMYERARRIWREMGDTARTGLSDAEMAEQFWLFDAEGIPRLKSDQGEVEIPPDSFLMIGAEARRAGIDTGQSDIADRSREILETEFADYLLARMEDNDDAPARVG